MEEATNHHSHFRAGRYLNHELGVFAGWTCHEASYVDCMPIVNETGTLTLLLAGEPLIAGTAITQLAQRGHDFDAENASPLVHLFEERRETSLEQLNGSFSGLLVDETSGACHLFCDPLRLCRIYYIQQDDRTLFATEAKALLSIVGSARQMDLQGLGQFVAFGCTLGDATLFRSVKLLPPAANWTFLRGRPVDKQIYFSPSPQGHRGADAGEDGDDVQCGSKHLATAMSDAVDKCLIGRASVGLSLTGGVDTRLILACLQHRGATVPCYTFGGQVGDTQDIHVARQLALSAGQEYEVIRLGSDFLKDFWHFAEQAVLVSDGTTLAFGAHEYYLSARARSIAPVRLTGNYGSEILHGLTTFKPLSLDTGLFSPELRASREEAIEQLRQERMCDPVTFAAYKEVPWRIAPGVSAGEAHVTVRTPYVDRDMVKLAYRLRSRRLASSGAVEHFIVTERPEMARIPTDRGVMMGRPGWSLPGRLGSQFTFKLDYLLGDGMPEVLRGVSWVRDFLPWRRHRYLDYRRWMLREGRNVAVDLLADPRTQQRPHFSKGAIHRLARDCSAGRASLTELNIVLSLELIHRKLLDG